jgi:hypothetical protein
MTVGRPPVNLWEKLKIEELKGQIEIWCRNGATDIDIAKKLHVGKTTFYRLKREFPEFSELLKKGKDYADEQVENALYKRAIGYEFEETVTEIKMDGEGKPKPVGIRRIKKIVVGDTTAQIFWLKNRKPVEWRDKQVIEHENNEFMQALLDLGREGSTNVDGGK